MPESSRLLLVVLLLAGCAQQDVNRIPQLGEQERVAIAERVFANECAGRVSCLTTWNKGEEFASLGIGHFIWYPSGVAAKEKRFSESFPALVHFLQAKGASTPAWLKTDAGCPWRDRASFETDLNGPELTELRAWLQQTMSIQADFMAERLTESLPRMLDAAPKELREHIDRQFRRVAASPMGMYALMDYVNFKGEGINPQERYAGRGWGLLQVLAMIQGDHAGVDAISAFAAAADTLLTQRVAHAPGARHEGRWLPGWRKRLQTYTEAARFK